MILGKLAFEGEGGHGGTIKERRGVKYICVFDELATCQRWRPFLRVEAGRVPEASRRC